jgi:hypothetical protein
MIKFFSFLLLKGCSTQGCIIFCNILWQSAVRSSVPPLNSTNQGNQSRAPLFEKRENQKGDFTILKRLANTFWLDCPLK